MTIDRAGLQQRYRRVREHSAALCRPLQPDDYLLQSMPDCSPPKWHLAHTTWFFEQFLLADRPTFHPEFAFLFNSYYEAVGPRHPRPQRGLLSRPTLGEVWEYRAAVDAAVEAWIESSDQLAEQLPTLEIGLQHEQQHQELLVTDLLHAFGQNPLLPTYRPDWPMPADAGPLTWQGVEAGLRWIGHTGNGFAFDNEGPAHRVFLDPFRIASRLVTNGEYRQFVEDSGYSRPELWLSDGWAARQAGGWEAPLYWQQFDGAWHKEFTPAGSHTIHDSQPVAHISFYEADAYARWAGKRLPTEAEWEVAVAELPDLAQWFGVRWQWTGSPYVAYPGYKPAAGALGEYNGKFMCNQLVLRGSSCATPDGHSRPTYRNFFPPAARWQFTGLRLTSDA